MKTIHPVINTVSSHQHGNQCITTFVDAFRSDPAARWLFPDAELYNKAFPQFVRAFAGPAFSNGTAHTLDGGAAAWFAPDTHGEDDKVIALLERTVPDDRLQDAFSLFEQMDTFHPQDHHWYLPLIGVTPNQQGQGIGSTLLDHVLDECDRTQMPAYLEASSSTSVPLYERHGFRRLGTIQAGSSPSLYPMLRNPQ